MNERIEAIVTGRVQMVMYRDFATRKARHLKLSGEVQNLSDGSVRVIAEGPRELLDAYIETLKEGPLFAHVQKVNVNRGSATGAYSNFSIRYD